MRERNMSKLILKKKTAILEEFEFTNSKSVYFLGSDESNDFIIDDEGVSIKHLKIERNNGCFYLEDLNSATGTQLNGRPLLNRVQIVDGDEISIGEYHLTFTNTPLDYSRSDATYDESPDSIADNDQHDPLDYNEFNTVTSPEPYSTGTKLSETNTDTVELSEIEEDSDDYLREEEFHVEEEEPQSGEKSGSYQLLAIYGPYLGKKFPLKFGDTKIGRDNTLNDIVIRQNEQGVLDPSISRRHATVSYKDGQFFVTDKRSKTRTYVNQIKLEPTDEVPLHQGDEIEIVSDQRSTIFRLISEEEQDTSPPRKSGVWWIRNKLRTGRFLSIAFGLLTLTVLGFSMNMKWIASKQPGNLKFIEEIWYENPGATEDGPQNGSGSDHAVNQANLALADLNGDESVDVLFTDRDGSLLALNGTTKQRLWQNTQVRVTPDIPLVLSDLNLNGLPDILMVGVDARLRALDGSNGAEIWLSPILGEAIAGPPVVDDFNNDGIKDVLICTQTGRVHLGYGDFFQIKWQTLETHTPIHAVPSSSDWDDDGYSEIFIGSDEGKVIIIDGKAGKLIQLYDFNEAISKATGQEISENVIRYPIIASDLNNNQINDFIIGSVSGNYLALEGLGFSRIWYDQLPNGLNTTAGENLSPVLGKFGHDDIPDVAIISNQTLKVIKGTTDPKNRKQVAWEYSLSGMDRFVTPPVPVDLNKDNCDEIVIGSQRGSIFILNGETGKIIAQINNQDNAAISPILVADLGGDKLLDFTFFRKDGNLYKIQTNSPINKHGIIWGQSFADARHSGRYEYLPPSTKKYDILTAAFGGLFLGIGFLTYYAKRNREKIIQRNHSGSSMQ